MTLALRDGSGLPLQDRVRRYLLGEIVAGRYVPGARLPTEKELAAQLGVSIAPVRAAMEQLAAVGRVERRQGSGTYVRGPRIQHPLAASGSLTDRLREGGLPFATDVVASGLAPCAPAAREALGPDGDCFHLTRRFAVEGRPIALLDSWTRIVPGLADVASFPFTDGRSLYAELRARGVQPVRAWSVVEVAFCDDDQAELMGVPFGTPALQLTSLATADGRPLEWSRALYSADRLALSLGPDIGAGPR
ncbi:MAG: GntR family transcriptional regulator [Actinobacteria bacterium]|nr:GntR family transcriptional regulator [Actinomycetota bacterium]